MDQAQDAQAAVSDTLLPNINYRPKLLVDTMHQKSRVDAYYQSLDDCHRKLQVQPMEMGDTTRLETLQKLNPQLSFSKRFFTVAAELKEHLTLAPNYIEYLIRRNLRSPSDWLTSLHPASFQVENLSSVWNFIHHLVEGKLVTIEKSFIYGASLADDEILYQVYPEFAAYAHLLKGVALRQNESGAHRLVAICRYHDFTNGWQDVVVCFTLRARKTAELPIEVSIVSFNTKLNSSPQDSFLVRPYNVPIERLQAVWEKSSSRMLRKRHEMTVKIDALVEKYVSIARKNQHYLSKSLSESVSQLEGLLELYRATSEWLLSRGHISSRKEAVQQLQAWIKRQLPFVSEYVLLAAYIDRFANLPIEMQTRLIKLLASLPK